MKTSAGIEIISICDIGLELHHLLQRLIRHSRSQPPLGFLMIVYFFLV